MASQIPEWKHKAAQKREAQLNSIPQEWRLSDPKPQPKNTYEYLKTSNLLTPQELAITETTSARALLSDLASGKLSAVAVTTAFCKRAAIAQQLIKCCTEMFFDEALTTARGLDQYLADNGKPIGPLHGLPVSMKDNFNIKGQDTTVGWVSEIGKPAQESDLLVRCLEKQGAVMYVKTNIPQSLMMSDSYNHVFKQSLNASNTSLISGGSSGGEGALIGCRGSLIGFGTDIGGSVRIPANLQGLYGLSPSVGRVPMDKSGMRSYIVPAVAGPLAQDLESLEVVMEAMLAAEPWRWDPVMIPVPWRRELAALPERKLRIGFYVDDGVVRCQPPIEAAVKRAVEALKVAGHEVFEWDTSTHKSGYYDLWQRGVLADGGRRCRLQCEKSNEPLVEGMLVGKPEDEMSVVEGEEHHARIRTYQKSYLALWQEHDLDALICPVQPYVGFRPKTWVQSSQYCGYTALWNLLDFAALTVPMGVAEPEKLDLSDWKKYETRGVSDEFNWKQYDPELIAGMPIDVQIVGGKFGEEKAVAVAKALEEALKLAQ
ncbi:unnamed protein product [Zymoseptoria tritici ST99CH_1E4]|uniref:amidase n=1 Tax=Zymoseptoria tritici ST99CH_1E4 TaxID=1276532 RepID=A0A2H1GP33_ZYMTR|nr:unnamed protein product [Zymoseptoria tritici ST99CH_1E4]